MAGERAHEDLRQLASRFAERDGKDPEAYPAGNIADLHEAGLIIAPFPREMGGREASLGEMVRALITIAQGSPSTALIASMPVGLAAALAVPVALAPSSSRESWARQREWAAGEYRAHKLFAACNSEKGAGGALSNIKTVARVEGESVYLTGDKILATGGAFADYFFSTAKTSQEEFPGCGEVEMFIVDVKARGVDVLDDWDGFGMRSTESQSVRYQDAAARALLGFPRFLESVQPFGYWYQLFSAVPLGCAASIIRTIGDPPPQSPAMRVRLNDALMRWEALEAYLLQTAAGWRPGPDLAYRNRALRAKTYVTQEATKLCAELFALTGGSQYRRTSTVARMMADAFAGTALRPPLPLALQMLADNFELGEVGPES